MTEIIWSETAIRIPIFQAPTFLEVVGVHEVGIEAVERAEDPTTTI